jgi:septal ring factor EnvC (AmiA/AmiB activator)
MSEPQDKLRNTLEQLRSQLDELRKRDPRVAEQLETTIAAAEAALAGEAKPAEEHASLSVQLSDAVREYEATHPALAGNLGAIIDALGRMGI